MRLAALQHDIGMAAWDAAPVRDPRTGLPYSFTSMPRAMHVELWTRAARLMVAQSPYAALLVSLHGTGLYDRYVSDQERAAEPARAYLEAEREWQRGMAAALDADLGQLERNAALLRCWDWLSLFVCTASSEEGSFAGVPAGDGAVALAACMPAGDAQAVAVSPWPFAEEAIEAVIDGRLLRGAVATQKQLDRAVAAAPIERLRIRLAPG